MFRFLSVSLLALTSAVLPLHAVPSVAGLQNNYSFLLETSPNHGIARGSIFIVYGSDMSGAGLTAGGFDPALDPNLGGVTIRVAVGGTATQAIPYYVSPTQLAAILPSATPAGQGTITVTYAGETSDPYPITVVESAFGLMTMGGNGIGQAVVMDASFNVLTPTNAPTEGQTVILWGSGLGAFAGDETRLIASPRSLDEWPFELIIGGRVAETLYHGRSQFPALDQIVAKIPQGLTGCYVTVYAKTGEYISNFTTIPIAASNGGGCSDTFTSASELQGLYGRETVRAGWLQLGRFLLHGRSPAGPTLITQDSATAQFLRYTPFHYANWGGLSQASFGSCFVSTLSLTNPFNPPVLAGLDAGELTLIPPAGQGRALVRQGLGYSLAGTDLGPGMPLFYGEPGDTFVFTATGGADVGAFSASLTLGPPFSVEGIADLTTISRNQDLTLSWTGGAPNSYVVVTGNSNDLQTTLTQFTCTARTSEGSITIPRDVLRSMIPSVVLPGGFSTSGQLLVYNYELPQRFSAPGVDIGNIQMYQSETNVVAYE